MADETCPHCKGPLSKPPPSVCPHCGDSISVPDRKFPTRIALGFLPAVLIGLSPLFANWFFYAPEQYDVAVFALNLFILLPFTLLYAAGWALLYRRDNPGTGTLWMLMGSLMLFLNCALGFGGCFAVFAAGDM